VTKFIYEKFLVKCLIFWEFKIWFLCFFLSGTIDEVILEGRTLVKIGTEKFVKSSDFINGLETHVVEIHEHLPVEQSQVFPSNVNVSFLVLLVYIIPINPMFTFNLCILFIVRASWISRKK
jgi:hypothetical protein